MKKMYLFYYEESESAWLPVPEHVSSIVDVDNFSVGDEIEIKFRASSMTEEEFNNLPEL